jgi:hypothetical protein
LALVVLVRVRPKASSSWALGYTLLENNVSPCSDSGSIDELDSAVCIQILHKFLTSCRMRITILFPDFCGDFSLDSERTYKFPEKFWEGIPAWKHEPQ